MPPSVEYATMTELHRDTRRVAERVDAGHVVAVADLCRRRRRLWLSGADDPPMSVALAAGLVRPA